MPRSVRQSVQPAARGSCESQSLRQALDRERTVSSTFWYPLRAPYARHRAVLAPNRLAINPWMAASFVEIEVLTLHLRRLVRMRFRQQRAHSKMEIMARYARTATWLSGTSQWCRQKSSNPTSSGSTGPTRSQEVAAQVTTTIMKRSATCRPAQQKK